MSIEMRGAYRQAILLTGKQPVAYVLVLILHDGDFIRWWELRLAKGYKKGLTH
jgi:hypothetical protein